MKKILFMLLCMCCSLGVYNAECNYTELKNLNTLASYVETSYKYDEEAKQFTLNINNIPSTLLVVHNFVTYTPENNTISISGFNYGERIKLYVNSSNEAECVSEYLRVINMMFPYLNPYYGDFRCVGHENLEVCSNRFLNYEITESTFSKLIEDDFQNSINNQENPENIVKKLTFFETVWKYTKIIGIPFLLVLVTSLLTFSICNVIYRKIKHGL